MEDENVGCTGCLFNAEHYVINYSVEAKNPEIREMVKKEIMRMSRKLSKIYNHEPEC